MEIDLNTSTEYMVIEGWRKMPAWNKITSGTGVVRYHIWGYEDGLDSNFVDRLQIKEADGNEIIVRYYAEDETLIVVYNGNRMSLNVPAPAFTYLSFYENADADEIISAVKYEISYLLSSLLS